VRLSVVGDGLVFGQTRHQEFVNLDDSVGVYENQWVTQGLRRDSPSTGFTNRLNGNWCPLTWISHIACLGSFNREDAGGHHLIKRAAACATGAVVSRPPANDCRHMVRAALARALWAIHRCGLNRWLG